MVDANSFTKGGQTHSFDSKPALFHWMIVNGELFLDGETASQMRKYANVRLKKGDLTQDEQRKYNEAIETFDEHLVE